MLSKKQVAVLQLLKAKKFQKNALKTLVDDDSVRAISECCLNALHGKLKLKKKQKEKLTKFKKEIRYLVNGKNKRLKKKLIIQKGSGFLPWILGPAISLISSLFTKDA